VTVQAGLTRAVTKTRLIGDPQRAEKSLGWRHSLDFRGLVELLVRHAVENTLDESA